MKILRTPDDRFADLEDYPFEPNYTVIQTDDGSDLRIHHLDEGPKDGPTIVLMHGQPTWSYLYRKMIPILTAAGLRVIAPDLPGFGKSDKPASRDDYTYNSQVGWMNAWLKANDFSNLTFFGQDWGGVIGLRVVADQPDRFDRVVISNTVLPHVTEVPEGLVEKYQEYQANAPTPDMFEMGAAMAEMTGENRALRFAVWQKFCWETDDIQIGLMMAISISTALGQELSLDDMASSSLAKAYAAPFPDPSYKMAPRAMPMRAPTWPDDPVQSDQARAWEVFRKFDKPFLCAFGDNDPVTAGSEKPFIAKVPGAKDQPHMTLKGVGHFLQEEVPEDISNIIIDFVRRTSGSS